jgi:hypothetical protein
MIGKPEMETKDKFGKTAIWADITNFTTLTKMWQAKLKQKIELCLSAAELRRVEKGRNFLVAENDNQRHSDMQPTRCHGIPRFKTPSIPSSSQ